MAEQPLNEHEQVRISGHELPAIYAGGLATGPPQQDIPNTGCGQG